MSLRRAHGLLLRASHIPCMRIRTLSTTANRRHASPPPTTCSPTCACAGTPPELDIDRATPLLHTTTPYAQHVLVCSGKDDWSSRIEDEVSAAGDFVRGLKREMGRGSRGFDVCLFPCLLF